MNVYERTAKRKDLRAGDTVKLMKKCASRADGWNDVWAKSMDEFVGKTGVIRGESQGKNGGYKIEGFDGWSYPVTCLRRIKKGHAHALKGEDVFQLIDEAPKPVEYKVGDMVVVSGEDRGWHRYDEGDVVEITGIINPDKWSAIRHIDRKRQYLKKQHIAGLAPVAPQAAPAPILEKKEGYDVGDEVVISGRNLAHHCFTEGEIVTITRTDCDDYLAKDLRRTAQYLNEEHISGLAGKPKAKKKVPKKKGDVDVGDTVEITGCKYYEHNIPIGCMGKVILVGYDGDCLIKSDGWKYKQNLHPSDFKKVMK